MRLQPDDRAPSWAEWSAWVERQKRPIAVDLFAGGGGLSLGLEAAGFCVALGVDHDEWAVETHAANFRGLSVGLDLSDPAVERRLIELLKQADVALIAGGPPCQPFSRAGRSAIRYLVEMGKRDPHDERRDLWRVWLRIVTAVRPRAVLLENVPDMALGDDLVVVREIVDKLQRAGYETSLDIVEAALYGVPQHRQRLILVAVRNDAPARFRWPPPAGRVSIWDAISDLPSLGTGSGHSEMRYRARNRTPFQETARAGMTGEDAGLVYDHVTRPVRDDDRAAFKLMGASTRYSELPEELRRYRADTFNDKYKRHGRHELARSITAHIAKDGYWYIHPTEERTLTVREAARLQTFPDRYRFAGTRTHAFRQIGNAVPPLLAEVIGRSILQALGGRRPGPKQTANLARDDLRAARAGLDTWAKADAKRAPWRHVSDPWTALLSSVLCNVRTDDAVISRAVRFFPSPAALTTESLDLAELPDGASRALRRLLPAAEKWRTSGRPDGGDADTTWWEDVRLKPAELQRTMCLGYGTPSLLVTAAPLRVAARVTGRPVDRVDKLTDGRLALALIVGGGRRAADRMAAVAALGQTVCTRVDPKCSRCPLRKLCTTAP